METILTTSSSPHIHNGASVSRMMRDVVISLVPCVVAALVFFDPWWRIAGLIAVCVGAAMLTEYLCRKAMRRENALYDNSALLTGLLLALILPPAMPFWQAAVGSVFAIAIGKQVFGGLGYNILNPALVGRAFMLISFTAAMTTWSGSATFSETKTSDGKTSVTTATPMASESNEISSGAEIVPVTTATPLGITKMYTKTNRTAGQGIKYDSAMRWRFFIGDLNGSIGETSVLAIMLGFVYLLVRRVITWHATAGYAGSVAVFALCLQLFCPRLAMPVDFHLMAGGALFGAVFMATDPVTTPITAWGRFIFGIGCGVIMMIIRVVPQGSYPEGVTFAILIMNSLTPLINRATRYKRFGAV